MALEDLTGTDKYIDDMVVTNPVGSTDTKSTLDDHIRGIKNVLNNCFEFITGKITATHTEINTLDGITSSTAELNMLDGVDTTRAKPIIEIGTWTPTIQDSSFSDAEGQTYTIQAGSYLRVANRVFINGEIVMSSLGTLTTSDPVYIAGLPFTVINDATREGGGSVHQATNLSITAGNSLTFWPQAATTRAVMQNWDITSGTSSFILSELTATGGFNFQGQFLID